MESKHSLVALSNTKLEFEVREWRARYEALEGEKKAQEEAVSTLEDRLREVELQNGKLCSIWLLWFFLVRHVALFKTIFFLIVTSPQEASLAGELDGGENSAASL